MRRLLITILSLAFAATPTQAEGASALPSMASSALSRSATAKNSYLSQRAAYTAYFQTAGLAPMPTTGAIANLEARVAKARTATEADPLYRSLANAYAQHLAQTKAQVREHFQPEYDQLEREINDLNRQWHRLDLQTAAEEQRCEHIEEEIEEMEDDIDELEDRMDDPRNWDRGRLRSLEREVSRIERLIETAEAQLEIAENGVTDLLVLMDETDEEAQRRIDRQKVLKRVLNASAA